MYPYYSVFRTVVKEQTRLTTIGPKKGRAVDETHIKQTIQAYQD